MKKFKNLLLIMMAVFAITITGCASTEEEQPPAVEVQPTADELEREQMEELSRLEQEELDALRKEEAMYDEVRDMDFSQTEFVTIYFAFDQFNLSETARASLSEIGDWLKSNAKANLQIEGHCDENGTDEYNLALGEKRAMSVKNFLTSLGVEDSRLFVISYGEEKPVDSGHSKASWMKNRRAEFKATAAN